MGYAISRNKRKINHTARSITPRLSTYTGTRANSICPTGFSGGALLDLGDFTSPVADRRKVPAQSRLCGILIEQRMKHRALMAVKIGPIMAGIERELSRTG